MFSCYSYCTPHHDTPTFHYCTHTSTNTHRHACLHAHIPLNIDPTRAITKAISIQGVKGQTLIFRAELFHCVATMAARGTYFSDTHGHTHTLANCLLNTKLNRHEPRVSSNVGKHSTNPKGSEVKNAKLLSAMAARATHYTQLHWHSLTHYHSPVEHPSSSIRLADWRDPSEQAWWRGVSPSRFTASSPAPHCIRGCTSL